MLSDTRSEEVLAMSMSYVEWQRARENDGHAHRWATSLPTTVDGGATYCTYCQKEN